MVRIRVEYDKAGCIGAAVCVQLDPARFVLDSNGKADLVGSHQEGPLHVLEFETDDPEPIINAAKGCPVLIIKVLDGSGKTLAP